MEVLLICGTAITITHMVLNHLKDKNAGENNNDKKENTNMKENNTNYCNKTLEDIFPDGKVLKPKKNNNQ